MAPGPPIIGGLSAPAAFAADATRQLAEALPRASVGWLVAAVLLHVLGQLTRGVAWHGILSASWPGVTRRRACAWHVCGAGFSGLLSARGGDAIRIALARRELPGATWPALAGTLVAEGTFTAASGLALTLVAVVIGVGMLAPPSPVLLVAAAAGLAVLAVLVVRSPRVKRVVREVGRGAAILRDPRRFARDVLPWQVAGRVLRLAAVWAFLHAVGLPAGPAVVLAALTAQCTGNSVPIPGASWAASAVALAAALPIAAGHPLDAGAIAALAILQPVVLTFVGLSVSLVLLSVLVGARSPRALMRATRLLVPRPAGAAT